jgi:hypothetical protein
MRHMTHRTPDERINDLCLEIQGESDKHKLLQLIDQLNGVLDVREKLLAEMMRQKKQLRCLRRRFDCYRVERTSFRARVAPAEVQRLSRRTVSPTIAESLGFSLPTRLLSVGSQ